MRYEVKAYIQGFGEAGYWQERDFYYPVAGESVKIDVGVHEIKFLEDGGYSVGTHEGKFEESGDEAEITLTVKVRLRYIPGFREIIPCCKTQSKSRKPWWRWLR